MNFIIWSLRRMGWYRTKDRIIYFPIDLFFTYLLSAVSPFLLFDFDKTEDFWLYILSLARVPAERFVPVSRNLFLKKNLCSFIPSLTSLATSSLKKKTLQIQRAAHPLKTPWHIARLPLFRQNPLTDMTSCCTVCEGGTKRCSATHFVFWGLVCLS